MFREMIEAGARGCHTNVICIFGEARRGKSTLMNLLVDAPPDRAVVILISLGSILICTSSTSGIIAKVAVEVCTRP